MIRIKDFKNYVENFPEKLEELIKKGKFDFNFLIEKEEENSFNFHEKTKKR